MAKQEVAARLKDSKDITKVQYDFGATLDESRKIFGDDVIFSRAKAALVIDLQALVRRMIKAKKTPAEITTAVAAWKPDVKTVVKKSASEKVQGEITKLSADERKALLKQLQAMG